MSEKVTTWHTCNYRGGGIDNTQTVNQEGQYSLDAVQNNPTFPDSLRQVLNLANEQIDNLFKMVQATGRLDGDVDWNNYKDSGVYKVQNAVMTAENHAPVGLRKWGILVVLVSETDGELRRTQIYFPSVDTRNNSAPSTAPIIAIRQYNHLVGQDYTDADWQSWYAIQGTLLAA